MAGLPFLAGAALGSAFVASLYNDSFRSGCRNAVNAVGAEATKFINSLIAELKNMPQEKDDGYTHEARNDTGRANGLPAGSERSYGHE